MSASNPHPLTVAGYLERWVETVRNRIDPATWGSYRSAVDRHLIPLLGDVSLAELSRDDVATFLLRLATEDRWRGRSLAPRTVDHCHKVLRVALREPSPKARSPTTSPWASDHPRAQRSLARVNLPPPGPSASSATSSRSPRNTRSIRCGSRSP